MNRKQRDKAFRDIAGLDHRQFGAIMRTAKGTPWLLKDGETIRRVVPGDTAYPVASAEDIARGKFYATEAEFRAENPDLAAVA